MKKRVSFYTLGCRLNQAETAIMQASLEREGFEIVDFKHPADVVVINTCTVTENSDADTRRIVNRINRLNPQAKIALVGCQAQVQREQLLEMPNVQWVVGNARKMDLAEILQTAGTDAPPQVITPVIKKENFTLPVAGIDRQHTRANLKIQDGCDFFCSFCVIPYARGRARSREFPDILKEAKVLLEAGHRELVITGINIGNYHYQDKTILDVVKALIDLPELLRLRISSIEPTTIPFELIELAAKESKLCRYFHIPLQSGSNAVLKSMNRRYSVEEFVQFIQKVDRTVPGVCQGTDVIVGFPGETNKHFQETYEVLEGLPLAYFHVFSYSERPWTKSRKIADKVPKPEIERRSKRLRELSAKKRNLFLQKQIGTTQWVLFEQLKKGMWTGLTDTYIRVKVKSDFNLKNEFLPVRLESIDNQQMTGTLL